MSSQLQIRYSLLSPCSSGSEAAGEDVLVGNVSKLTVSPPGYTGATRKGHLVFDACFESGKKLSFFFFFFGWRVLLWVPLLIIKCSFTVGHHHSSYKSGSAQPSCLEQPAHLKKNNTTKIATP